MAIYSLNVGSVGRSTHAAGTAGAHLRYIGRKSAVSDVAAHDMPREPQAARSWMDQQEAGDRANARVCDRIRLAIPRELDRTQRLALVKAFCSDITGDRVAWFAAIHQDGDDAHNPHAHIVVRDRDRETGKRVLRWSDSARDRKAAGLPENAVEHVRARWEWLANQALAQAGHDARIDRRTLEAQGIKRDPTIHIGPNARLIDDQVQRPTSRVRVEKRGGRERRVDYPMIDAGRTRKERHAEIVDLNLERDSRSPDFGTRTRAKLMKEEIGRDRLLERALVADARRRTLERRRLRAEERGEEEKLRATRTAEFGVADRLIKERFTKARDEQRQAHEAERTALAAEQNRWNKRLLRRFDAVRRKLGMEADDSTTRLQARERRALVRQQLAERKELADRFAKGRASLHGFVEERFGRGSAEIAAAFAKRHVPLAARHDEAELEADRLRQQRAAERAQAEAQLEEQIRTVERFQRQQDSQKNTHKPRL